MIGGVLDLMLCLEIFGSFHYVVVEEIMCGCIMWMLLHIM